jgi:hypothetical protein
LAFPAGAASVGTGLSREHSLDWLPAFLIVIDYARARDAQLHFAIGICLGVDGDNSLVEIANVRIILSALSSANRPNKQTVSQLVAN